MVSKFEKTSVILSITVTVPPDVPSVWDPIFPTELSLSVSPSVPVFSEEVSLKLPPFFLYYFFIGF